jgi:2-polyprenyl-6-methoxyphenol hydroxylase-like FAD-dependent oxidoreductase
MNRPAVIIVGAGPIGLDLACRLLQEGISVRVLEKRTEPTRHSRSIGIQSPALEALAEIFVTDELLRHGVHVTEGIACSNGKRIGTLTLDGGPPPFQFILSIPQYQTEQILETRVRSFAPDVLERDVHIQQVRQDDSGVEVRCSSGRTFGADYLVGCDGGNSTVRDQLGIPFPGGPYDDAYVMGDYHDGTDFGPRAVIFLTPEGLVESFPLPDGIRRWVARTDSLVQKPDPQLICGLVRDRTGIEVDASTARMTSGFQVFRFLAAKMSFGRILLSGDAAHVISPIGGQGMTLGWLDNREAAAILVKALAQPRDRAELFAAYSARRRKVARKAARRAEFNMAFGRPGFASPVIRLAARAMLKPPFSRYFIRRFTMRNL